MKATLTALRRLVKKRFGGVLKAGKHSEDGEACALECLSVLRGLPWTDNPGAVRSFDLRSLNDIEVPDEVRAKHLLPVMAVYDGSLDWPKERQQEVATRISIGVVNVLIAELACLPAEIAKACREAKTRDEARSAARTAAAARGWHGETAPAKAVRAAELAAAAESVSAAAAESAAAAALAAAAAVWWEARERVFVAACRVWLDAAKK